MDFVLRRLAKCMRVNPTSHGSRKWQKQCAELEVLEVAWAGSSDVMPRNQSHLVIGTTIQHVLLEPLAPPLHGVRCQRNGQEVGGGGTFIAAHGMPSLCTEAGKRQI